MKSLKDKIANVTEEIIVVDSNSGNILSYCSVIERAALTLKTFNPYKREYSRRTWQGFFILLKYLLYKAIEILEIFDKEDIYYGDFKEENLLLAFGTLNLTLCDLGTSFAI